VSYDVVTHELLKEIILSLKEIRNDLKTYRKEDLFRKYAPPGGDDPIFDMVERGFKDGEIK